MILTGVKSREKLYGGRRMYDHVTVRIDDEFCTTREGGTNEVSMGGKNRIEESTIPSSHGVSNCISLRFDTQRSTNMEE